jgi:hypothetical protein
MTLNIVFSVLLYICSIANLFCLQAKLEQLGFWRKYLEERKPMRARVLFLASEYVSKQLRVVPSINRPTRVYPSVF